MARSKVKSRSHHNDAHLKLPTNVATDYQLPIPYSFPNIARQDYISQGHYGKVKDQINVTFLC